MASKSSSSLEDEELSEFPIDHSEHPNLQASSVSSISTKK